MLSAADGGENPGLFGNRPVARCGMAHALRNQAVLSRANQPSNIGNYMNTLIIKGNWNIAKGKLKQKYAQLTDDDLQYVEGSGDELVGRIQKRTGEAREAIERTVKECFEAQEKNGRVN